MDISADSFMHPARLSFIRLASFHEYNLSDVLHTVSKKYFFLLPFVIASRIAGVAISNVVFISKNVKENKKEIVGVEWICAL